MTFRVLSAEISHETNTFSVRATTLATFDVLEGAAAIATRGGANTQLADALDAAREKGWRLVHTISAHAPPGGRVARDAFERLCAPLLEAARGRGWDGALLGLHGAMVTEDAEDGEGELLTQLRAALGPDTPVAVSLDPHANVSRAMVAQAQILTSFDTYPHVDMRATAAAAGRILHRAMTGEIAPRTLRVGLPMLEEADGGRTDIGPMIARHAAARAWEARDDVFAVSINGAFPQADIAEVGPTVLVCAEGDMAAHRAFAEGIAADTWARRDQRLNDYLSVEAAASQAAAWTGARPLVVADYADNPGAGAHGDGTTLLAALLAANVRAACFGPMVDPEAAAALVAAGVGAVVDIALGGRIDARFGGGPLSVRGQVAAVSDGAYVGGGAMIGGLKRSFGPTAVLVVDGIEVLVVSRPAQILDLQQFRAFGIDPAARSVVALKSMQHFRADFEPVAGRIIVCDSGALCTLDYARLPFARVPRPIHPLDEAVDVEGWVAAQALERLHE